jgi:ribosomal protein S18 acetylase RimI-like enzyme
VPIEIHQVGKSSAIELSELCATTFADAYHDVDSAADIKAYCETNYAIEKVKTNLSNPDVIYKIAYRENKAVGFFMIQNQDCPNELDGNAVELKQIYVMAGEFGSGLGKQLLDEAIQCATKKNKWLWLSVSNKNTRAQAFYLKHGFESFGAAPVLEVGNGRLPATVMKLELT